MKTYKLTESQKLKVEAIARQMGMTLHEVVKEVFEVGLDFYIQLIFDETFLTKLKKST